MGAITLQLYSLTICSLMGETYMQSLFTSEHIQINHILCVTAGHTVAEGEIQSIDE